ncbi:MAG: hypothetical protein LYZ69_08930 [Nitrososphaerales archaeon]|nr:hypothetical protein [Nitrososphaerales archaeon]
MSSEIAEELSKQTQELVSKFESRAASFSQRRDLTGLTLPADARRAEEFAVKLFGRGEHIATGIDGSMDFDERLQMILFYSNATAYNCTFTVNDQIHFDLDSAYRDSKLAASAAVPLWSEDLANVSSAEPEIDIELEHSMERIPNSFMTLGELFLANLACEKASIVFLDRPMSGTYSTLSRDARNLLKRKESNLTKWPGENGVTLLDLHLAIKLGSPAMVVPTRSRYLPLAIIQELMDGPKTVSQLATTLKVGEGEVTRAKSRLEKLDKMYGNKLLADSTDKSIVLAERVTGYWERVSALSMTYARDVFERRRHPLALGGDEYITILDVNAMSLFLLDLLCQRAKEKGVLLIGIAKDTTATDIARAVLPFAASRGFLRLSSAPPRLKNDRAFLAILSSENPSIKTPWRTMSYDSAFSTVIDIDGNFVSARKVVSREKLFVRSFFQLRSLKTDPSVRSQVFLFDRVYDARFDADATRDFSVKERAGTAHLNPYFEGDVQSQLSNLILHILSLNDNPEVFEAFGHNQLLYLADKAVKAEVRMLRSSLHGVADLRVGGVSSRRKIFGLVTPYRQQRAEAEHARMRSS